MTSLLIRDAQPGDIASITAIYADAVIHGTASFELDPPDENEMRQRFETLKTGGYPYVVALRDGVLVGYAYAGAYRPRPAYRWSLENSVYIDEAAKGQGVGKALLREIIARCTALGFRQMISVIGGSANAASIALHQSLGFDHVGVLPATGFKHGQWLDSVLMQLAMGDGASTDPDPETYPGTLYTPKT